MKTEREKKSEYIAVYTIIYVCIHIIRNNKANSYMYFKEVVKMLHVLQTTICTAGDLI